MFSKRRHIPVAYNPNSALRIPQLEIPHSAIDTPQSSEVPSEKELMKQPAIELTEIIRDRLAHIVTQDKCSA